MHSRWALNMGLLQRSLGKTFYSRTGSREIWRTGRIILRRPRISGVDIYHSSGERPPCHRPTADHAAGYSTPPPRHTPYFAIHRVSIVPFPRHLSQQPIPGPRCQHDSSHVGSRRHTRAPVHPSLLLRQLQQTALSVVFRQVQCRQTRARNVPGTLAGHLSSWHRCLRHQRRGSQAGRGLRSRRC